MVEGGNRGRELYRKAIEGGIRGRRQREAIERAVEVFNGDVGGIYSAGNGVS